MKFNRTSAADAFKAVIGSKHAAMPKKQDENSRLATPVKPVIHNSFTFGKSSRVFTIGSCFARNIEGYLKEHDFDLDAFKFKVPSEELNQIAPFPRSLLNKYTPFSMINEVAGAFGEIDLNKTLVEISDGKFLDMQMHTDIGVSMERAMERREYVNEFNRNGIANADVMVITLGLVESWFDLEAGMYTNQAPSYKTTKKFPDRYQFEVLSPDVVGKAVTDLIELLLKYGKLGHKVLLTVSPVPIGRSFSGDDVLIANTYSKAVLRAYAEQVKVNYDHVDYVPTYEALTLADREVTWMEDNIHIQADAVKKIINHVIENYLVKESE